MGCVSVIAFVSPVLYFLAASAVLAILVWGSRTGDDLGDDMYQEPLSILIVDDEESFASILAEQLNEEFGYQTTIANSGRRAIDILQNTRRGFDVVLLDYKMPDLTGLNVLQWMHEQKMQTPAVILTAAGSEAVAVEAMKLGAYDYLRKEQLDVQRLALVIQSTHERHLFRIVREIEEDRWKETKLNTEATDRVRDVLNAITPKLNETFAAIGVALERDFHEAMQGDPRESKAKLEAALRELQKNIAWLERGVQGLLSLYALLYAHHTESKEIDLIRRELEATVAKAPR